MALAIAAHPQAQLIYSDEDKLDEPGLRYDPYFKPDYSPELFRSQNYFNHLTVHRAENIRAVGGWRKGLRRQPGLRPHLAHSGADRPPERAAYSEGALSLARNEGLRRVQWRREELRLPSRHAARCASMCSA